MHTRTKMLAAVTALLVVATAATAVPASGESFGDPLPAAAPPPAAQSAQTQQWLAGETAGAPVGNAEARSISATPDTDLVDGQAVQVDGSGFGDAFLMGIVQCAKGLGLDGCETSSVETFEPETNGSFSETFVVEAILDTEAGTFDCRTFPAGCRLLANDNYEISGAAKVDIAFDPVGPLEPLPTVAVTPDTDLLDGQTVTVSGSGFHANTAVTIIQCPAGTITPDEDCQNYSGGEADGDGNLSVGYRLEATLQTYDFEEGFVGEVIDCRDEACELVASSSDDADHRATAALAFDPDGPLAPDMALDVTPTDDLVEGKEVDTTVSGYTWNGPVDVVQCSFSSDVDGGLCDMDNVVHLTTDDVGNTATPYVVHEQFDGPAGQVNCLVDWCILVAVDRSVSIAIGRGYLYESLNFANAVEPVDPGVPATAGPADPGAVEPSFTG